MKKNKIVMDGSIMKLTYLFIAILAIISLPVLFAALTGHYINTQGSLIYTDQNLICHWTPDATSYANVSWFKDGVLNRTQNDISCTISTDCQTSGNGNVPQEHTIKGQNWTCSVTYYNGVSLENDNSSIIIQDSIPTYPTVTHQNGSSVGNGTVELMEDNTTILIINSTDADGDIILYVLQANSAGCTLSEYNGTITCAPTTNSQAGIHVLRFRSEDNVTGATKGYTNATLNITAVNDAPSFSPALQNQSVNEGAALTYTITGSDEESNTPYNFTVQSNLNLIVVSTSSTTGSIRFNNTGQNIANYADRGNHTVNVTIYDSGSPSKNYTSSFTLNVLVQNHLANISYIVYNNDSLIQGGNLSIYINATDIDNDTLTFYSNNTQFYSITYQSSTQSNGTSTFAYAWLNVTPLNNSHVLDRNINIIVFDGKQNNSVSLFLNITNANDRPSIYNRSVNAINTLSNINITSLIAYNGVLFKYQVNYSDPDLNTYAGDTLTFSTNDSNFPINSTTGLLQFTPSTEGNFSFIVSILDAANANDSTIANITILPNNNPSFNPGGDGSIQIICYEYDSTNNPNTCYYNMSSNVSEPDAGDYIATFWTNSTLFSINATTGIINFTATQSNVGNYSVRINATDSRGGMNSTVANLTIYNINNKPVLSQIIVPSENMIVGGTYVIQVYTNDSDLYLSNTYENLTLNNSYSGLDASIFSVLKISEFYSTISFTATSSAQAGNYTINISLLDYFNNRTNQSLRIYIFNATSAPNISQISPFGSPYTTTINTSWRNWSDFNYSITTINISENSTYTFNQTSSADLTNYPNGVNYSWYYDGSLAVQTQHYNKSFGFFSSGNHNITFVASDQYQSNASFTWLITVNNLNRGPVLANHLLNLTINGTTLVSNYMTSISSTARFIDYDDDTDSSGIVDGNETNTLTFNATQCSIANFTFSGADLRIRPAQAGTCYVNFTAYDATDNSIIITSNTVKINITDISIENSESTVETSSSSGGGSSSSSTVSVTIPEEVEKPKPLQLITPKLVTVYKNATISVPIVLNNTWTDAIEGIAISAYTNASDVSLHLSKTYFSRIDLNGTEELTLTIGNYKSEGHYEIQLRANVTNPAFDDLATIYVNSADQKSEGEEIEQKISFARDLLSSNQECQELTELLNEAKKQLGGSNFIQATKLVDNVINGCKYLVMQSKIQEEVPSKNLITSFEWKSEYTKYGFISGFVILMVIALYYIFKKDSADTF